MQWWKSLLYFDIMEMKMKKLYINFYLGFIFVSCLQIITICMFQGHYNFPNKSQMYIYVSIYIFHNMWLTPDRPMNIPIILFFWQTAICCHQHWCLCNYTGVASSGRLIDVRCVKSDWLLWFKQHNHDLGKEATVELNCNAVNYLKNNQNTQIAETWGHARYGIPFIKK